MADRPRIPPLLILLAVGVGVVVAGLAIVALTSRSDPVGLYATLRPAPLEPGPRLTVNDLTCVRDGRAVGPSGAAWPAEDPEVSELNHVRGQALAYEILIETTEDLADDSTVTLDVDLDRYRGSGTIAFDERDGVLCAFVDSEDPAGVEVEGSAESAVSWQPVEGALGVLLTVDDLDAGETIVVEFWAALSDDPDARAGVVRSGFIGGELSDESSRVELDDIDADIPVRFTGQAGGADLELEIGTPLASDSAVEGSQVTYRLTATNVSETAAASDVRFSVDTDARIGLIGAVRTVDEQGAPTNCEPLDPEGPGRVRCTSTHMNPGEEVLIEFNALIASVREGEEQVECGDDVVADSCLFAEVAWDTGSASNAPVTARQPTDITESANPIALAKTAVFPDDHGLDRARAGEQIRVDLIVFPNGEDDLTNVQVTDKSCTDILPHTGDANGDGILSADEDWRFICFAQAEAAIVEPAELVATTLDGEELRHSALLQDLTVIDPELSGGRSADLVIITNTGDDPLRDVVAFGTDCAGRTDQLVPDQEFEVEGCAEGPVTVYATDSLGDAITLVIS